MRKKRRRKMTRRGSKRLFKNTAKRVHRKNLNRVLHRGGYML